MEISSGEKICFDAKYRISEFLAKRMAERSIDEELLNTTEDYAKISQSGLQLRKVKQILESGNSSSQIIVFQ